MMLHDDSPDLSDDASGPSGNYYHSGRSNSSGDDGDIDPKLARFIRNTDAIFGQGLDESTNPIASCGTLSAGESGGGSVIPARATLLYIGNNACGVVYLQLVFGGGGNQVAGRLR